MSKEKKSAHRHMKEEERSYREKHISQMELSELFRNLRCRSTADGVVDHECTSVPLPEGREKHISQIELGELF